MIRLSKRYDTEYKYKANHNAVILQMHCSNNSPQRHDTTELGNRLGVSYLEPLAVEGVDEPVGQFCAGSAREHTKSAENTATTGN